MKRLLSLFLALVLLLGILPTASATGFTDVPDNSWYRDAVNYAVNMGLMNGVGGGKFEPETSMSRAMLVTVLWRYAGSPKEGSNTFTDVRNGQWYTDAIAWAAENGVVTGVGGGKFDPDGSVTREQLAVVLFRYSNSLEMDTSARRDFGSFPDAEKVSSWATDALSWTVAIGMINGIGSGSHTILSPQGSATRAQVAAILMRYIQNFCHPDCVHSETVTVNAVSPTCTTDGYTGDVCCAACGLLLTEGELISKLFHSYNSDGVCINCGLRSDPETIQIGSSSYTLGMSLSQLTALAGAPDEALPVAAGYTWYVFGTHDYSAFFMAGIYEDTVVSLCATGTGFTYQGKGMGDELPDVVSEQCRIRLCNDKNDSNIFFAVQLTDMDYSDQNIYNAETLSGESRANFHLTNAFRVYHGSPILKWSDAAATSARLHSEDMANQDYFDHTGLDGRGPGERMQAQGIQWFGCSENICAGYRSGFEAYNGWVNSAGHRTGMLRTSMEYLGVGFAVKSGSSYFIYATQNYYY